MLTRAARLARTLAAIAAANAVTAFSLAQQSDQDQGRQASATLPESNEAILLSSRIEEATQAGDFHLAVQLIGRMMEVPGELVAAPASNAYDPIWRQVARLVGQLPPRGLEIYRQLHDAEVAARYHEALEKADTPALVRLFRVFPLTASWHDIGRDAAARLIDAGEFGQAIDVLRELIASTEGDDSELRGQLLVALGAADAARSARTLYEEISANPALRAQPAWRDRLAMLAGWIDADLRRASDSGHPFSPSFAAGPAWAQPLAPDATEMSDDDGDVAEAVDALRRMPLIEPVVVGDTLLVRVRGRLWAFDALTLAPRWSELELRREEPSLAFETPESPERADEFKVSRETRLLLEHHLRHVVSASGGRVFTIEGLTLRDDSDETFRGAFQLGGGELFRRNEIVARSLATGRVEWRTSQDPTSPLAHVAFQDRPLPLRDKLVVPFHHNDDLRLAIIDATTGRLEREVPIVGPPTRYGGSGGRCLLGSDGQAIYVATGNGVIAALSAADFSWRWGSKYFSTTLAEHLGRLWWQPREAPTESSVDRPIVADDLLVVAPIDSNDIFALDRFSGRERWRIARREYAYVVGVVDGGLIVGSNVLVCLDVEDPDGRPPRWRSVPLEVSGRPTLRSGCVFVPTRRGIVVLNAQTGKIVGDELSAAGRADAPSARRSGAANLVTGTDALFAVSPSRVVKFPDLAAVRARLAHLPTGPLSELRSSLTLAWLDLFGGQYDDALRRVEAIQSSDPALAGARDRLLTHLFLELAGKSSGGPDRLAWLKQAAERVTSPEAGARLAAVIGDTLEQDQRWTDALDHYTDVLTRRDPRVGTDEGDPQLRNADWLHAAARVSGILRKIDAGEVDGFVARALETAQAAPDPVRALQRLRIALEEHPRRAAIDVALSQQRLWPELAIQYLPESDDPGLAEDTRRRIQLTRWETHVSLNRLEEAKADAAYWHEHFAAGLAASGAAGERELESVAQIQRMQDKLSQIHSAPFARDYPQLPRWKIKRADLLLDVARPLTGARPWILVRNFEAKKIQLIDSIKHQSFAWRQIDDAADASEPMGFPGRVNMDMARRPAWPVVVYGDLAAIPARGQLIGMGLAPQSRQSGPLWSHPVPAWSEPPHESEAKLAAGPRGVYFLPRPDRIALIGWLDGKVWWQRDFPGAAFRELHLRGDDLIAVTDDRQVFLMDATFGGPLRQLPTDRPTPSAVDVVGDRIVVWKPAAVIGFDRTTLSPVWSLAVHEVEKTIAVHGRDWLAFRQKGAPGWQVLDATSGKIAIPATLMAGEYTSAAVQGDRLLIAAQSGESGDAEQAASLRTIVAAYNLADGVRAWHKSLPTSVPVNLTQLCDHPQFIPVLLNHPPSGLSALLPDARPFWAIQLIDKSSGETTELNRLDDRFDAAQSECDPCLLVTPARIIVQIHGNVLGFGNPPEAPEP